MKIEEINKLVTEALGECWHEQYLNDGGGILQQMKCRHCQEIIGEPYGKPSNKNYAENIADAWVLEDFVYQKGLADQYTTELMVITGAYLEIGGIFKLVHATPEQRCLAFLKVVGK